MSQWNLLSVLPISYVKNISIGNKRTRPPDIHSDASCGVHSNHKTKIEDFRSFSSWQELFSYCKEHRTSGYVARVSV